MYETYAIEKAIINSSKVIYGRFISAKVLIGSFIHFLNEKIYNLSIFSGQCYVLTPWRQIVFWNTLYLPILDRTVTARVVICRDVRRISAARL